MRPNLRRGQQQVTLPHQLPAPIGGINAVVSAARMSEDECIYAFNILPSDYGTKVRRGYVEWANGWDGPPAKTVITFEGNIDAEDKMWVANEEGIWDVTLQGETTPNQDVVFPSSGGNAGVCSYINYSNDGNDRFVLLCDGENGYYIWQQSTDTWTKSVEGPAPGEITGIDPSLFEYVVVWKQRVWFIERDSANAWYLDTNEISGDVSKFNFGSQFRFGGSLRVLKNWTIDGGDGIDDRLIAISGAGDVIMFQGTDPAAAETFGLVGSWYIGRVPNGNRIAKDYGGEIYILSVQGLVPLSLLLKGSADIANSEMYITNKISPYIRGVLSQNFDEFGWHVHIHPNQSYLYVNSPPVFNQPHVGFAMYLGNFGWAISRGISKNHSANWNGQVFWCDAERNKIFFEQGNVDDVLLDSEEGGSHAIEWNMLTAFAHLQNPASYKRCQYIRPMFVGGGEPSFFVQAQYDYDLSEHGEVPPITETTAGQWDDAIWNQGIWGGNVSASDNPRGANGMGRHIAVYLTGRSAFPTTLIAFDMSYDVGGLM